MKLMKRGARLILGSQLLECILEGRRWLEADAKAVNLDLLKDTEAEFLNAESYGEQVKKPKVSRRSYAEAVEGFDVEVNVIYCTWESLWLSSICIRSRLCERFAGSRVTVTYMSKTERS
jgi:hypothetical protein